MAVSALHDMVNLHKTQGEYAGRVYDRENLMKFIGVVHDTEKHLAPGHCVGSTCNVSHKVN